MTTSPVLETLSTTNPDEKIFPEGDFWSDEPPLESDLHLQQIFLLLSCLDWLQQERNDYYASGNLTIYYNEQQLKKRDFCGPDVFVVLGTEKRPRKSWVVWGEGGKYPNVIVDILSNSTAKVDRTEKKPFIKIFSVLPIISGLIPTPWSLQGLA